MLKLIAGLCNCLKASRGNSSNLIAISLKLSVLRLFSCNSIVRTSSKYNPPSPQSGVSSYQLDSQLKNQFGISTLIVHTQNLKNADFLTELSTQLHNFVSRTGDLVDSVSYSWCSHQISAAQQRRWTFWKCRSSFTALRRHHSENVLSDVVCRRKKTQMEKKNRFQCCSIILQLFFLLPFGSDD